MSWKKNMKNAFAFLFLLVFFCPKKKKEQFTLYFFPFIYPETFRIISKISHCSKMKHEKEKHRKSRTENSQDEQSADFENILFFLAKKLVEKLEVSKNSDDVLTYTTFKVVALKTICGSLLEISLRLFQINIKQGCPRMFRLTL